MSEKTTDFSKSGETVDTENTKTPEISFEIAGEKFTHKPFLQGFALLDFLEASDGENVQSLIAFRKFLKDAVTEEEWKRIDDYCRNSDKEIGLVEITKGVAELIQAYTSRPTVASEQ